jgi:hypothetical protein
MVRTSSIIDWGALGSFLVERLAALDSQKDIALSTDIDA